MAPLRVLIVQPRSEDVAPLVEAMRRGGVNPQWERVDTKAALVAAVDAGDWKLIVYCETEDLSARTVSMCATGIPMLVVTQVDALADEVRRVLDVFR
jgi:hypothetical protein